MVTLHVCYIIKLFMEQEWEGRVSKKASRGEYVCRCVEGREDFFVG